MFKDLHFPNLFESKLSGVLLNMTTKYCVTKSEEKTCHSFQTIQLYEKKHFFLFFWRLFVTAEYFPNFSEAILYPNLLLKTYFQCSSKRLAIKGHDKM